jgi:predicted Zn-dependent protease
MHPDCGVELADGARTGHGIVRGAWRVWLPTLLLAAAAALSGQSDDLVKRSNEARRALLGGQYAEAVELYRALVREMPNEPGMHLNLGLALEKAGQPSAAIPELESVTRAQPKNAGGWFLLGLAYAQLNRPGAAISPLKEAVRLDRTNSQALLELADAELGSGDAGAAAHDFAALASQHPEFPKAWEGLGLARLKQSEKAFADIEKQDPQSAWRVALLARTRATRGETGEALRLYGDALSKNPGLKGAHAERAALYREIGRADLAARENSAEAHLPDASCSGSPALCLYAKGDFSGVMEQASARPTSENLYWSALAAAELAQQSFARLAKLPPSSESHELLAASFQRSGRRLEAIEEWRKAMKFDPGNASVRAGLAESLYRAREYEQAETLLKPLVASHPENADWQYLLGSALLKQKRDEEALPYLEKAAHLNPDFLPGWENLGLAYLDVNQPAKAAQCLERARPLDQGSISFALSNAYRRLGRADDARSALARYRQLQGSAGAPAQR